MKTTKTIWAGAMILLLSSMSYGATFFVPDDYPTIQDAINNVSNNDTIIVRAGTYFEGPLNFRGKSLVLLGESGPELTTITMDPSTPTGSVIGIVGNQSDVTIKGFYITGGTGDGGVGGGIRIESTTAVTIRTCHIIGNSATARGGGVFASTDSSVQIFDCIIKNNTAGSIGGGAYLDCNALAQVSRSYFLNNFAALRGGGLRVGTEFSQTSTANHLADNCAFSGNISFFYGGAMSVNPAQYASKNFCGALHCTFSGNVSPIDPIISNESSFGTDQAIVRNSILANNVGSQSFSTSSPLNGDGTGVYFDTCLTDIVSFELATTEIELIAGIIVGEAGFADEFGPDGTSGTGDEDFGLSPLSAAIDQATENLGATIDNLDLLSNPRRIDDPLVQPNQTPAPRDLGATEFNIDSPGSTLAIWNAPGETGVQFMDTAKWYNSVLPDIGVPALLRIPNNSSQAFVEGTTITSDLTFDGGSMAITAPNGPEDASLISLFQSSERLGVLRVRERLNESTFVLLREVAVAAGNVSVEDGELRMNNTVLGLHNGGMTIEPSGTVTFDSGTSVVPIGKETPSIINHGVLEVDGSSFESDYSQSEAISEEDDEVTPPGTLIAEIAGSDDASTDPTLDVTGDASIGGTLAISTPGSAPSIGTFVPVLGARQITGEFELVFASGLPDGRTVVVQSNASKGTDTTEIGVELSRGSDTTFDEPIAETVPLVEVTDAMLADLEGDGDDDLIISIDPGDGTTFGFVGFLQNLGTDSSGGWLGFASLQFGVNTLKISGSVDGLSVGNVDGDSFPDIVAANKSSGTVHVLQNTTASGFLSFLEVTSFDSSPDLTPGSAQPTDTWLGDLDNDGLDDLVVTNETDGSMVTFENVSSFAVGFGPGSASTPKRKVKKISPTGTGSARDLKPAGIGGSKNSEGNENEGESESNNSVGFVQTAKQTSGLFGAPRLDWTEHEVGEEPVDLAIGDINKDNIRDIVTANSDGESISVLRGISASTFEAALTIPIGSPCEAIELGDFDYDGDLDIAVLVMPTSGTPGIRVLRNDTTSTSLIAFTLESDIIAATDDTFDIHTGRLDGDYHDDILVLSRSSSFSGSSGLSVVWSMTSTGINDEVCLGDVNNDGQVDGVDLTLLLGQWNSSGKDLPGDLDEDGFIDGTDLTLLLGAWGTCNPDQLED